MIHRFTLILSEIQDQKEAQEALIDAKKAELAALEVEIPQLEADLAQIVGDFEIISNLFTNAQVAEVDASQVRISDSTPVNVRTITRVT